LNDPLRWNGSAFSQTPTPHRAFSAVDSSSGVRCATPDSRAAAASTRSKLRPVPVSSWVVWVEIGDHSRPDR
jgi:hypothetical protein